MSADYGDFYGHLNATPSTPSPPPVPRTFRELLEEERSLMVSKWYNSIRCDFARLPSGRESISMHEWSEESKSLYAKIDAVDRVAELWGYRPMREEGKVVQPVAQVAPLRRFDLGV